MTVTEIIVWTEVRADEERVETDEKNLNRLLSQYFEEPESVTVTVFWIPPTVCCLRGGGGRKKPSSRTVREGSKGTAHPEFNQINLL